MGEKQTVDSAESAYKRGYRQGMRDAQKEIEVNPRIEVWDFAAVKLAEWLAGRKIDDGNRRNPDG